MFRNSALMFGNIYKLKEENCISQRALPSRCCSNTLSLTNTPCHRGFYLRIQIKLCQTTCLNYCIAPQFLNDNMQALTVVATMGFHPSFTCYVKHHKNSQLFQTRGGENDFGCPSECFDQVPDSLRTAKVLFPFSFQSPPSLSVPSLQMDGWGQVTIETNSTNGQDWKVSLEKDTRLSAF